MAIPNPFRRLTASTSTVDDLSLELGRQDRIRLDAQNTLHDLGARRPALLIDGTDAALAKLDAEMATARRTLEQAEARIAVVEPEWRAADARESEARTDRERRQRHAAAVKARAEGVKILDAYEREAAALAAKLRRLEQIGAEIVAANADLPADAAPIGGVEAFNGTPGTADSRPVTDHWVDASGVRHGFARPGERPPHPGFRRVSSSFNAIPGVPGLPHRSLLDRVALPALDLRARPHWCGPQAAGPALSADAAAVLRFHGVQA